MVPEGFFDRQFKEQVEEGSFELNPFEQLALEHLQGRVLDLGAGLGNLSLEAGRRGHEVLAVERCPTAIGRIRRDAAAEGICVEALEADVLEWAAETDVDQGFDGVFDTAVAIGLLMFFRREHALRILEAMCKRTAPGGLLILNVLIEGTTFMDMFEGDDYHLFAEGELADLLPGWEILYSRKDSFEAPRDLNKDFQTIVFKKPVSVNNGR